MLMKTLSRLLEVLEFSEKGGGFQNFGEKEEKTNLMSFIE